MTNTISARRQLERLMASLGGPREELTRCCTRVPNWNRLFDEAFEQGVAGVLAWQMAAVDFPLPSEVRARVEHRLALDRLWHRRWNVALREILRAFRAAHLRGVVLTGGLLSERLYPQASLRPTFDVDFLTTPADCSRAQEVLKSIGYRLAPKAHDRPPLEHLIRPFHLRFHHPSNMWVELHYSPSSGFCTELDAEEMVTRSISTRTASGDSAWILAPEDEFIYLAVHLARHRLVRLGWLYDIKLFVQAHSQLDWVTIADRAHALGVLGALCVVTELLEGYFPGALPQRAKEVLPRSLRIGIAAALAVPATGARFSSRNTPIWATIYRVLIDRTYRALLSDQFSTGGQFWLRSMQQESGKFGRWLGSRSLSPGEH